MDGKASSPSTRDRGHGGLGSLPQVRCPPSLPPSLLPLPNTLPPSLPPPPLPPSLPPSFSRTNQPQALHLLSLCTPGDEAMAAHLLLLSLARQGQGEGEDEGGREEGQVLLRIFRAAMGQEEAMRQSRLLYDRGKGRREGRREGGREGGRERDSEVKFAGLSASDAMSSSHYSSSFPPSGPPSALPSLLLSPSLSPLPTLLPLPPHWLLLPLASSSSPSPSSSSLAARLLLSSLSFLLRPSVWRAYTSLLPPGLLLYYCMCLSLFPPEVLGDDKVKREGGREGRYVCICLHI